MKHQIWMEGWSGHRAQGDYGTAQLVATVEAPSFQEACDQFFTSDTEKNWGHYDRVRMTVWGCRLFINEADARKAFG